MFFLLCTNVQKCHICGWSANLTNYWSPQLCGTYLWTAHLWEAVNAIVHKICTPAVALMIQLAKSGMMQDSSFLLLSATCTQAPPLMTHGGTSYSISTNITPCPWCPQWIWVAHVGGRVRGGGHLITQKHGPHKCRLYWCSMEFIDWKYSQSCWYFRPALWSIAPLTFSLPFPVWICILYTTMCKVGGGVWGHRRREGVRQINTCRQVPLLVNFKENRHLGFGVFIYIWSMHKSHCPPPLPLQNFSSVSSVERGSCMTPLNFDEFRKHTSKNNPLFTAVQVRECLAYTKQTIFCKMVLSFWPEYWVNRVLI